MVWHLKEQANIIPTIAYMVVMDGLCNLILYLQCELEYCNACGCVCGGARFCMLQNPAQMCTSLLAS